VANQAGKHIFTMLDPISTETYAVLGGRKSRLELMSHPAKEAHRALWILNDVLTGHHISLTGVSHHFEAVGLVLFAMLCFMLIAIADNVYCIRKMCQALLHGKSIFYKFQTSHAHMIIHSQCT
jgi:hypothetical protein